MKLAVTIAALALGGCSSCTPAASPPTPTSIHAELVEAGCMADSPDGVSAVTKELALKPPPLWMQCLADGGSVAACGGCPK